MPSTETPSYTRTAKFLHWLIAAAIIFQIIMGWCFDDLQGETKFFYIQLHKSIGITILLLSLFRLIWRLAHRAPPLPATMPLWEKGAAHFGHFLLYALMIGMPLTGWAMVSSSPYGLPTVLYGVVPWPHLPILPTLENKAQISHVFRRMHGWGGTIFAVLIAGHAAAALKHHFISRDDILLRMAPRCVDGLLNRLRGQK